MKCWLLGIGLLAFGVLSPLIARAAVTGTTGGGAAHTNMQPSLAMNYIVALEGIFPAGSGSESGSGASANPFLAGFSLFAGDFAPEGWALADGALLQISQNGALHALLGTTYGGDGVESFALPDLRGRAPIGFGEGPGLTDRMLGQSLGVESVALSENQMPAHTHAISGGATGATGGGGMHTSMQPSLATNYIIATSTTSLSLAGQVSLFGGSFPPDGWLFADGTMVPISEYPELFALISTIYGGTGEFTFGLPDLRGRAAIGAGLGPGLTARTLGNQLGAESVTLTQAQLPSHSHSLSPSGMTGTTGDGEAHANMQPALALNYIISLAGTDPTQGGGLDGVPFIGELTLYAGSTAPDGWALANGALLPIDDHPVLYDVLGTIYGGDGDTMFALPDLRGRVAIGAGEGTGLTERLLGEELGAESVTLSVAELPAHVHELESLTGDYNFNNIVDAADYTVWRNALSTQNLDADGNGDMMVDQQDLTVWKMHFGETGGSGASADSLNGPPAVPEPSSVMLWLAAASALMAGRRRRIVPDLSAK